MTTTNDAISKAASALDALEPKAKSPRGMMAVVDALYDKITDAIDKGYSYEEIAKLLEESGCKISASTLRQYYSEKKKASGTARKRRQTTRKSDDKVEGGL
jgi:hypothetical protein